MMRKKIKFILGILLFLVGVNVKAGTLECEYYSKFSTENMGDLFEYTVTITYKDGKVEATKNVKNLRDLYMFAIVVNIPNFTEANIRNGSDYKLACPTLYSNLVFVNQGRSVKYEANIGLVYNKNYEQLKLIKENVVNDETDTKGNYEERILDTCVYNSSDGKKVFSFTIMQDGSNKYLSMSNSAIQIIDSIDKNLKKCPDEMHYSCSGANGTTYCTFSNNSGYYKLTLAGSEISADSSKNVSYISSKNNSTITIYSITKDNYRALINNTENTANVNNISSFSPDNPYTYIIRKGSTYSLTNSLKNASYDEIFILKSKVSELSQLPESDLKNTCEAIFGKTFINFLQDNVFKVIYITVPIILLVLTTVDFSKVVFVDDKEGIKKAGSRFGKRLIAAILIYLTPTILIFIVDIIGADEVNSCMKMVKNYSQNN